MKTEDQARFNQLVWSAREKASHGDIDRAAAVFEEAVSMAELIDDPEILRQVIVEAIDYYAAERLDQRLIPSVHRFITLMQSSWREKDERYLPYLDHLCRAYYRRKSYENLEKYVLLSLDYLLSFAGEKSSAFANGLEYAANLLSDAGKPILAAEYKARCREIRRELYQAVEIQRPAELGKPPSEERRVYLGLILTCSGIVPSVQFQEHLRIAKQLGLPVGEVLVSAGLLTEEQLFDSLQLQSMVWAEQITLSQAGDVLAAICKENLIWSDALNKFALAKLQEEDKNRLGRMLVAAGFLTERELNDALKAATASNSPLGRYLVVSRLVVPTIVARAIELQQAIFDGHISREQALEKLRQAASNVSLMESLSQDFVD